jgi:hypothetical protein
VQGPQGHLRYAEQRDVIIARIERLLAAAAILAGTIAWIVYSRADLVLSHYDAKAHLVVSRRIIDNLTPGWQQIGAVWLPLPHLLNLLPSQIDLFYRTGTAASAISIASFSVCAWATARLVLLLSGSVAGAITAVSILALNPNLLYLQATPMTEPLLLGLTSLTVLRLCEWVLHDRDFVPPRLGWTLVTTMLVRYEAWPVMAAAIAGSAFAIWRRTGSWAIAVRRGVRLAMWPIAAVLAFVLVSRITVGAWFVAGGFYVPDPEYRGKVLRTLISLWWGTHELSGYFIECAAMVSALILCGRAVMRARDAAAIVPVALLASAALPFYAFVEAHPYRIRYMIPLVAACATLAGIGVGMIGRRMSPVVAALLIASAVIESPPWNKAAPMLIEAQWDRPASLQRRVVTACLLREYRGEKIFASMASLAHYMQELSSSGINIRDFVHEGNGVIWDYGMQTGPALHAGWMLVEEQAEGGDILAQRIRTDAAFTRGMERVCEGGGVALYRRRERSPVQSQPLRAAVKEP